RSRFRRRHRTLQTAWRGLRTMAPHVSRLRAAVLQAAARPRTPLGDRQLRHPDGFCCRTRPRLEVRFGNDIFSLGAQVEPRFVRRVQHAVTSGPATAAQADKFADDFCRTEIRYTPEMRL